MHARQRTRPAGIDAFDARMGMRAGEQNTVEHPLQTKVVGENRTPLNQFSRINLDFRLSDHERLVHLWLRENQWR